MRGRRPKPTALRKLEGKPGHRPLNDREPEFSGVPDCPDFVQGAARTEWHRVAALLGAAKLLTDADRTALAAYCQAYAAWLDAGAHIKRLGAIVKTPNGYPMVSPYVAIEKQAFTQMCKLLVEFGMTPASRSRLRIAQPDKTEDPLDAFLKRGTQVNAARVQ